MRTWGPLLVALVLAIAPTAGCIADFPPELVERKDSSVPRDTARHEGSIVDAPKDTKGLEAGKLDTGKLDTGKSDQAIKLDQAIKPDQAIKLDAPMTCPPGCGNCPGGVCTIVRGANTTAVPTCPPKMPCKVICSGDKACENGVDCSQATACDITCDAASGTNACKNAKVKCGSGHCKVSCTGKDSCNKGIDCGQSCGCYVYCKGPKTCSSITCPASPTCCFPPPVCKCP
jgi:hypothetical protein